MVSIRTFRQLALSFPESKELPHFDKASFRVRGKIFATMQEKEKNAVIKLSLIDQSVFCSVDKISISPVPGGWGRQGWTRIELKNMNKALLKDALTIAWCNVAPKKLVSEFTNK